MLESKTFLLLIALEIKISTVLIFMIYRKWKRDYAEKYHYRVAVHECGHALLHCILLNKVPKFITNKLSHSNNCIRGQVKHHEDNIIGSIEDYENNIMIAYGGSIAEKYVFGSIDVGSQSDKQQAKEFCEVILKTKNIYMDETCFRDNVRTELENYFKKAESILEGNTDVLDRLIRNLCKHRFLLGHHVQDIVDGKDPVITLFDKLRIYYTYHKEY
jgi:ATP-dependent Zn protease